MKIRYALLQKYRLFFVLFAALIISGCAALAPQKITFNSDAFFASGSYDLKDSARVQLNKLIASIIENKATISSVVITGHTDNVGGYDTNQLLSERRAISVRNYMVSRGVNPRIITAYGRNYSQPVAPNTTNEGRARNRRVEVDIVGSRSFIDALFLNATQ